MAEEKQFAPASHRKVDARAHVDASKALTVMKPKTARLPVADSDGTEDRPDGFPFTRN